MTVIGSRAVASPESSNVFPGDGSACQIAGGAEQDGDSEECDPAVSPIDKRPTAKHPVHDNTGKQAGSEYDTGKRCRGRWARRRVIAMRFRG